jgi:phage terminase small subunit
MLTPKQEEFVKNIIDGKSQAEAYRNAYSAKNMSDNAIYREASLLMSNPKIAQRLKELRDQMAKPTIMSAQERLEFLSEVINGTKGEKVVEIVNGEAKEIEVPTSMKNRLSAVDIMNKMQGEYTTKIEGDIKVKRLEDLL